MVISGHPLELGIVMAIGSEILTKGYLSGCLLAVITMEEFEWHSSYSYFANLLHVFQGTFI